jgi:hypothetical protein
MASLINRSACKKFVLSVAEDTRTKKFTRVSADVFDHLEYVMQKAIRDLVRTHPTIGKTIMMSSKTREKELNELI